MVVESGGKITVGNSETINSSSIAKGTYTLTGNVFKGTYTYLVGGDTYSFQANWSNDGKMTGGTWGSGSSVTNGGTWLMDRKN